MATLTFLGAVGEVTGSRYRLDTDHGSLLLECGLHQGGRDASRQNRHSFTRELKGLKAVVVSHGHLDHSGMLPKLVRDGWRGPIWCTPETCELLTIMLEDSANVMAHDIAWENKWRQRAGKPLIEPLYDLDDVRHTLKLCKGVPYGEPFHPLNGTTVVFRDAGHILGSAIVEINVESGGRERQLVFSGDLGNAESALMRDPQVVESADHVLLESTYGNRDHRPMQETVDEFAQVLEEADRDGGNVLIPAFAVGRTQEILYHLGMLHHQGRLKQQSVFLDSPMGLKVTELYTRRRARLDPDDLEPLDNYANGRVADYLPILQITRSPEESMAINRITGGAIIIAGAGMCEGGRIRHHFKYNLWRRDAHVVIVGFQARGTLGRKLVDGMRRVKLLGVDVAVQAKIHTIGGFSAHAGQSQLLDWAARFKTRPQFHLVHGEPEAREALAAALKQRLDTEAHLPGYGETMTI
ncbi:MAG: MBL fold metallo-hydrolase [Chromatiales bacterium]|nr:MBL fold metallo-hydrolase [Chromatiales bacterium]